MTVKLITFKTNHTIIARTEVHGDDVTVKEPVQVVMQPSEKGPLLAFAPFLEYASEFKTGITFDLESVLCITTPVLELENQYNQVFGSGIQIASAIPRS
jgi:hypothetical protein